MPSALPIADPAPADGLLPSSVTQGWGQRAFGMYVHVPFCRVRCGYCDFNTYTADEIRGVRQSDYAGQALAEVDQAARVLAATGAQSTDRLRGTSFAAPLVAGRLALRYSKPSIDAIGPAVAALVMEARDLGKRGRDKIYGHGLICGTCGGR